MKPIVITGKVIVVLAILVAAVLTGSFSGVVDYFGFLFVVVGGIAMTLMGFSVREISAAFRHASNAGGEEVASAEIKRSGYFWEAAARNFLIIGVLGALVGYVLVLGNLDDPKVLGPALSVTFSTILYGVILGAACAGPALVLNKRLKQSTAAAGEPAPLQTTGKFKPETVVGYFLFLGLMLWAITPKSLEYFLDWPSLLVVVGGAVAIILFSKTVATGQPITMSFAFTGFTGSLIGLIMVLKNLTNPKGMGPAMAFAVLSCFAALLGIIMAGLPTEDRANMSGKNTNGLTFSRIAWYGFPVMATIIVVLTISVLIFAFSNIMLK